MLQDMIHPPERLPVKQKEGFSSPTASQILDFCDDSELFPKTLSTSEGSSSSGCGSRGGGSSGGGCNNNIGCYEDISFSSPFSALSPMDSSAIAALLDTLDIDNRNNFNHSSASAPPLTPSFPTLPCENLPDQFEQIALTDAILNGYTTLYSSSSAMPQLIVARPQMPLLLSPHPPPPSVSEEECMMTLPGYMDLDPSQTPNCTTFMDQEMGTLFLGGMGMPMTGDRMYAGSLLVASERAVQKPDMVGYPGESGGMGHYGTETGSHQVYSSSDLQVFGDNQSIGSRNQTTLASDMSPMDESSFKVGRISVEERKEKILRYQKKRNERNFSKKIKYACRKTLADSRPRVRGRFAKNDDYGETSRVCTSNHYDEEFDDETLREQDRWESPEVFAYLNPSKCQHPLESWI